MNKIFSKNIYTLLATFAVGGLLVVASQVFAEIPGEYLSANVGAADLSGVALKWPYLLLIGLIIVFLLVLVSVSYHNKEKK